MNQTIATLADGWLAPADTPLPVTYDAPLNQRFKLAGYLEWDPLDKSLLRYQDDRLLHVPWTVMDPGWSAQNWRPLTGPFRMVVHAAVGPARSVRLVLPRIEFDNAREAHLYVDDAGVWAYRYYWEQDERR
ncbi:hypothetical protein BDK92_7287 [Micromonospora pisi]|uniref:Uncharacterized protein n=1 Tax=Micromonospora pisi TaxID=589240 RepID=A0A495JW82_9ACTN|nr:hypothetical protein [Micromonospora pisi]RKR92805.1 hypothetical protein BDK92_7287 [Micromonospora pisi]